MTAGNSTPLTDGASTVLLASEEWADNHGLPKLATVLDGGLWDVVYRKIEVNLRVLTSWRYLVLAIGGVALTALVVTGPHPRRGDLLGKGSPMAGLRTAVPLLKPAVAAIGLALTVGFLINDSGIVVPATGIALAVPCLVAAAAQGRLGAPDGQAPEPDDATPDRGKDTATV